MNNEEIKRGNESLGIQVAAAFILFLFWLFAGICLSAIILSMIKLLQMAAIYPDYYQIGMILLFVLALFSYYKRYKSQKDLSISKIKAQTSDVYDAIILVLGTAFLVCFPNLPKMFSQIEPVGIKAFSYLALGITILTFFGLSISMLIDSKKENKHDC